MSDYTAKLTVQKYYYYWSFPLRFPLIAGWSAFCWVTGLMVFLHLHLSPASAISSCFLQRSALITSFHLNFGLPWGVGPSTSFDGTSNKLKNYNKFLSSVEQKYWNFVYQDVKLKESEASKGAIEKSFGDMIKRISSFI